MFDYLIDQLIEQVFGKLYSRMKREDWTSFKQLQISSSAPSSVSSGMQYIDKQYIPVSEYFLHLEHKACKSVPTASVQAAARASSNPALKAWAFELEQLDIIEKSIR